MTMPENPRYAAVTIASKRYMALARVTAVSFIEHNPDMPFFVLLADEEKGGEDLMNEPFNLIRMGNLKLPEPERFCFQYTELEFSYALTPYVINHLLGRGFDGVLFLKQESLVLGALGPVLSDLARYSVLLTPHFLEPPTRPDALIWEINVLRAGIFNGGFIAFANCEESRHFLAWWQDRTFRECIRDVRHGIHFEQRWLDFVPSMMPGYGIVRDPGVNVGHWNLPDRDIRVIDGKVTAKGGPCRVFRFSGYNAAKPERVTMYNRRYPVADTGDAAEVFARYRALLMEHGHETACRCHYAYGRYDNGVAVTDASRRIYRRLGDEVRRFGNPFESSGTGSYYRWLKARRPWVIL